jgi:hypothetical protein
MPVVCLELSIIMDLVHFYVGMVYPHFVLFFQILINLLCFVIYPVFTVLIVPEVSLFTPVMVKSTDIHCYTPVL